MNVPDMDVQDFVRLNVKRRVAMTFGEDDPVPEVHWSVPYDDPLYLDLLQRVKPDQWNEIGIREYWLHLHIGSDLPN